MKGNRVFDNYMYALKLVTSKAPWMAAVNISLQIATRLFGILNSVWFLNRVLAAMEAKRSFGYIAGIAIVFLVARFVLLLISNWYDYIYKEDKSLVISAALDEMLFRKASKMPLCNYETPEFYNKYQLAKKASDNTVLKIFNEVANFIGNTSVIISGFLIILSLDAYLCFSAVFAFIAVPMLKYVSQMRYALEEEKMPNERRKESAFRIITHKEYAKERRFSNISRVIDAQMEAACRDNVAIAKKSAFKRCAMGVLSNQLTINLMNAACYLYAAYRLFILKDLSISTFGVMFAAIGEWVLAIRRIIYFVQNAHVNSLGIDSLREFLDMDIPDRERGDAICDIETIEFKGVSFGYTDTEVLHDINMKINRGEKIALAGPNGAGKTSLIKLAMELYKPWQGTILVNGRQLDDFSQAQYQSRFAVVFQDYVNFGLTVRENLVLGQGIAVDESDMLKALEVVDLRQRIEALPQGLDTIVGREFDKTGVVFSGGEAQRFALARMLTREYDVAIMDEPSAKLDPIAESQIIEKMISAVGDKTCIFISHRMSMMHLADRIMYIEDGRILEQGTHEELMTLNGRYAHMYTVNAESYKVRNGDEYEGE